jgi:peptidoglycan/LPS O-acetylase OafA/YrhL
MKLQLQKFYIRRAKRLIPALGTLILAVMVASYLIESSWGEQQRTALSGIASTFSFANIRYALDSSGYFSLAAKTNPLLHIWSLSVEEQFYIVFPILVLVLLRKSRNIFQTKFVLLVIAFISFVLSILLSYGLPPFESIARAQQFGFYMPFTRTWEFLAGVLIALPMSNKRVTFNRLAAIRSMQILAVIGIFFILYPRFGCFPWVLGVDPSCFDGSAYLGRIIEFGRVDCSMLLDFLVGFSRKYFLFLVFVALAVYCFGTEDLAKYTVCSRIGGDKFAAPGIALVSIH